MTRPPAAIRANFLVLTLTERCNLSCAYCYAGAGEEGAELDPETALLAIRSCSPQALGSDKGQGGLTVELTGGEPLTVFPAVKEVVTQARKLEPRPRLALQTNGLLLDKDNLSFLLEHRVGLGLSLDGLPQVNDLTRGRSGMTLRALDLVDQSGAGVNLTVVLTKHNLERLPEFLLFCAARPSIRVINLDLVRRLGRARGSDLAPGPEQIEATAPRLIRTLAFINARRFPPLKVREIDQVHRRRREKEVQPYCLAACGLAVAVDAKGRLWPCASLAGREELAAGTIWEPEPERLAGDDRLWGLPPECVECPTVKICRGGCPSRRLAETGRPDVPSAPECLLRRSLHRCLEKEV